MNDAADTPRLLAGGCLCGAVRYELIHPPRWTSACHCRDCQKASGAPFMLWSFLPANGLRITRGTLRIVRWADRERGFCGGCGSPLTFFDPALPEEMEVATLSLDDPDSFPPRDHNWMVDHCPWLRLADDLPCYEKYTPSADRIPFSE